MDTASIPVAKSEKKAAYGPCGCERRVGGRAVLKCERADMLWARLIDARDGLVGFEAIVGRRASGHRARLDRFATAKAAHDAHVAQIGAAA